MEIIKIVVLIVSKTSNPVSQSQDITHVEKKGSSMKFKIFIPQNVKEKSRLNKVTPKF
jgi:hypothetical protein